MIYESVDCLISCCERAIRDVPTTKGEAEELTKKIREGIRSELKTEHS